MELLVLSLIAVFALSQRSWQIGVIGSIAYLLTVWVASR